MVCREFPTASSNKVGTKLGEGAVILSPTRIVKIQNKSGHYAFLPPYLSLFPPMSPLTILQIPLFLPFLCPLLAFSGRRHSLSPFTPIYIVISQPFLSSDLPLPFKYSNSPFPSLSFTRRRGSGGRKSRRNDTVGFES